MNKLVVMRLRPLFVSIFLGFLTLAGSVPCAHAQATTYTYTGAAFTGTQDLYDPTFTIPGVSGLSGSITLANPLPPNYNNFNGNPMNLLGTGVIAYSFTDGVTTLSESNTSGGPEDNYLAVVTNAEGQITQWYLVAWGNMPLSIAAANCEGSVGSVSFYAASNVYDDSQYRCNTGVFFQAYNYVAGSWTGGSASCQNPPQPGASFKQYAASPQVSNIYTPQTTPYSNTETVPQYFGLLPNPNPASWVLCATAKSGCALTSLATMLTTFNDLPSGAPSTATDFDAAIKNEVGGYLKGTSYLCPLSNPNCSTASTTLVPFTDQCETDWFAPQAIAPSTIGWIDGQEASSGQLNDAGASVSVNQYLNDHVCGHQDRVVLEMSETVNGAQGHPHFIYVEGQASGGNDWTVFDPGWSNAPTTLSGHIAGFTDNKGNERVFTVAGVRTYRDISSTGNASAFNVSANSPVELLVVDPMGNELGNAGGNDMFGIPNGSYTRDFPLANDVDTGVSNGDPTAIKTANVPSPSTGVYSVTATGTGLGTYTLRFRTLDTTGNVEVTTLSGIANTGSSNAYEVTISSTSAMSASPVVVATFQSTLGDIANSVTLEMIKNGGVAKLLSDFVEAASLAASKGDNLAAKIILEFFEVLVNAFNGTEIIGVAPQVLQADGSSLISQLT